MSGAVKAKHHPAPAPPHRGFDWGMMGQFLMGLGVFLGGLGLFRASQGDDCHECGDYSRHNYWWGGRGQRHRHYEDRY